MRMNNALSTLVGEKLVGHYKWKGCVAGVDGSIYGIPYDAHQVVKFNPVDKSITHIGPDFGDDLAKWCKGAMAENGIIYCVPFFRRGILKIDTNTDTVTELDVNLLPEQGDPMVMMWTSCAAALDGFVYFMPNCARRIMKLAPNNNDAMSSVGDDLGDGRCKYIGTVIGIDGCVYGVPNETDRILKYDQINDITSFIGEGADEAFSCTGDGGLGRDGHIYVLRGGCRVLKIDTTNGSYWCAENNVEPSFCFDSGWGDAILGIDGCIYWPPTSARRALKYDPHTNLSSRVGDDFGSKPCKWESGSLAFDGVIYCIPTNVNQVLITGPLGEFSSTTKANMEDHPEEFGFLFQTTEVAKGSPLSQTNFDHEA